jgi:hypothetical protein
MFNLYSSPGSPPDGDGRTRATLASASPPRLAAEERCLSVLFIRLSKTPGRPRPDPSRNPPAPFRSAPTSIAAESQITTASSEHKNFFSSRVRAAPAPARVDGRLAFCNKASVPPARTAGRSVSDPPGRLEG